MVSKRNPHHNTGAPPPSARLKTLPENHTSTITSGLAPISFNLNLPKAMPYLPSLNEYLHHSSLLISAYPDTRITTRYSLPRKPKPKTSKSKPQAQSNPTSDTDAPPPPSQQHRKDPSATLTLKTYHPRSGICLKYQTDKAQEVGRLMIGLGRLAKGEIIDMPVQNTSGVNGAAPTGDAMDVDESLAPAESGMKVEDKVVTGIPAAQAAQPRSAAGGQGGGGKKKKKGKK